METIGPLQRSYSRTAATSGAGTADSRLVAFDAALADAGIHNVNLIQVSSISSEGTTHTRPGAAELTAELRPGTMVPAVYARMESSVSGDRIHAAVAGATLASGYGINVEHHGRNTDPTTVRDHCRSMLAGMAKTRGDAIASDVWIELATATVDQEEADWTGVVASLVYLDPRDSA